MAKELDTENIFDDPIITDDQTPADDKKPVGRPAAAKLVDDKPIDDIKDKDSTKPNLDKPIDDKEPKIVDEPLDDKDKKDDKNNKKDDLPVDEDPFIAGLAKKMGIELAEDEEYPEDEEGLIAFIQRQKEVGAQEIVNDYFNSVHPKAGELFDLVNMISDLPVDEQNEVIDDFFKGKSPDIDYKSVDLKNEEVQKSVLRTYYKSTGLSDEQITKKLDKFAIAGMLEDESTEAATLLASQQEGKAKQILYQQKVEVDKRKREANEYYTALRTTVDKGQVGEFTIPANERKATFEYIAKGEALAELNKLWATQEGRIQLALMLKNNFKLDKYINQAAKTQNTNTLRNKLASGAAKLKSSDPRSSTLDDDWSTEEIKFK